MANLLQVQPELRYGAAEIKQDPWFDNISFEKLFLKQLEPPNFDWKPEDSDQTQLGGCCQFNGFDFDPEEGNIEDEFQDF